MDEEVDVKIVVVGTSGVGKTSLAQRFTTDRWHPHSSATVGASFVLKRETIRSRHVALHIWDTAGQERFRSMVRACPVRLFAPSPEGRRASRHLHAPEQGSLYFRGALAAILVYDVTSHDSFDMLPSWLAGGCGSLHAAPELVLRVRCRPHTCVYSPAPRPARLPDLRRHAEPNVVLAVAANKVDEARQAVSEQEGAKFAHSIGARWLATSAKTGEGVQDLFMGVARRVVVEMEAASSSWPRERLAMRGEAAVRPGSSCC